jgi:thioredoxin reductase (NADPH)
MAEHYDAIILGAGPAGLTAGIYLARARLKPLIIDSGTVGGQMVLSYSVANYPGVETSSGHEISRTMLRQAKGFGAEVIPQATITQMRLSGEIKVVEVEDEGTFLAPVVIIAPGGTSRTLGLASEERFKGQGISYCATCDGDFFTDKAIAVIGGGNSALEEAVSLTKYASHVTVIHEHDEFQAQPWIVDEARKNPKISFLTSQRVIDFRGQESLRQVVVESKKTGESTTVDAEGCFVFIGYVPNTKAFEDIIDLNERGEVIANEQMETSLTGVYVAGDARVKRYRQITTAVSDGTIAALAAADYIQQLTRKTNDSASPSQEAA